MALFQVNQGNNQQQQPVNTGGTSRTKSILRYTMMPEILPRIRALGLHFGHFAYLLALVFSSARLIPHNHPVLNAANIGRFGVRQVIAMAANNVTWSMKNIDQIAIFGAIVMGLIMIVIQAGLIAFAALVGFNPAEASPVTSFFSPGGTYSAADDPMMWFFAQVFGDLNGFWGHSFTSGDQVFGTRTAIHTAMYSMLSFYSMAMMVVAVVIIIYYIMTVVGEAAKTGTPFGQRFNSLWAPIRLVIALGLLVPLGSGLNSAQYITLWVAKVGSGLGTNVWNLMVPAFEDENAANYIIGDFRNDWVREAAMQVFTMEVCRHAENKYNDRPSTALAPSVSRDDAVSHIYEVKYELGEGWLGDGAHVKCGEITLDLNQDEADPYVSSTGDPIPLDTAFSISKSIVDALVFGTGLGVTSNVISEHAEELANGTITIGGAEEITTPFETMISEIMSHADSIKASAFSSTDSDTLRDRVDTYTDDFVAERSNSWVYSGVWYLEIARIIEGSKNVQQNTIPNLTTGDISYVNSDTVSFFLGGDDDAGLAAYWRLSDETTRLIAGLNTFFQENRSDYVDDGPNVCDGLNNDSGWFDKLPCFVVMMIVPKNLVVLADPSNQTLNPMASLVNAGYEIFDRAFKYIGIGLAGSLGGAILPGTLGDLISGLGGMLIFLGSIGLGIGFILAFLLPVLPFIYFFFAVVSWMMEIFEAIIAMPLWALAHLRIDGDGMPGQAAINGYYLLLAILLRPALIVLSLVAAAVIFGGAIFLLQFLYHQVLQVQGSGSTSGFELVMFSMIFAYITYMAGVTSFKLVDSIPDQILRWIGNGTQTFSDGHDVNLGGNQELMAAAGGIIGSQLAGHAGGLASSAGKGAKGLISPRGGGDDGGGAPDQPSPPSGGGSGPSGGGSGPSGGGSDPSGGGSPIGPSHQLGGSSRGSSGGDANKNPHASGTKMGKMWDRMNDSKADQGSRDAARNTYNRWKDSGRDD